MRIAVIGAGIGGLTVAAGLQADGHEVVVYEQRDDPSPVGAGLTLFGNAFEALDLIGLGDSVRTVSSNAISSMRSGQRRPSGRWMMTVPPGAMDAMRSVHRVELHRALAGHLAPGTVRTGVEALPSPDGSPNVWVDGVPQSFDLVIAADGIRSRAREMLGLDPGIRYAGCTAWRGVTRGPVDLAGAAGETWGQGRIFGVVPLPDERVYWFATVNTPERTVFADDAEAVRNTFAGWHEQVGRCIEATDPGEILRHDLADLRTPLPTFVRGRTVLLGDAAHAMTPNLGQGAGQGIEDAATLCLLLRDAEVDQLTLRLARYDELRQKRTASVLKRSRSTGHIAQASGVLAALRDALLTILPGSVMGAMSHRLAQWPKP